MRFLVLLAPIGVGFLAACTSDASGPRGAEAGVTNSPSTEEPASPVESGDEVEPGAQPSPAETTEDPADSNEPTSNSPNTPPEPEMGSAGSDGSAGSGMDRPSIGDGGEGAEGGSAGSEQGSGASGAGADGDAGAVASGGTGGDGPSSITGSGVEIDGTTLFVDGEPFHVRGVSWNPVGPGDTHPQGLDYTGYAATDVPLMQAAGINAVRTYEPLLDRAVLDRLYDAGIYVLNSVYPYGGDDVSVVTGRVEQVMDHPAVLMWLLGNEWNYNGLYVDLPHDDALARLNEAAELIRAIDTAHPIATVYGELPASDVLSRMPEIDVWGINSYRGISFGALFSDWQERTEKPMFLSEYGADAYNANIDAVDLDSQAEAVLALTREIADAASANGAGPCMGGTLFEWADEWWKDQSGSASAQDIGGIAPGGGPHPDATFNEEWWGVVDIERNTRPAYDALAEVFLGG